MRYSFKFEIMVSMLAFSSYILKGKARSTTFNLLLSLILAPLTPSISINSVELEEDSNSISSTNLSPNSFVLSLS